MLRGLHNRINYELRQRYGDTQAEFDGAAYRFHMTVMMDGQPIDVCRRIYREIPDSIVDRRFNAGELAMFVHHDPMGPAGEYVSYRRLPLSCCRPLHARDEEGCRDSDP